MTKQQLQLTDMVSVVLEHIEKNIKSSQKNNELLEKVSLKLNQFEKHTVEINITALQKEIQLFFTQIDSQNERLSKQNQQYLVDLERIQSQQIGLKINQKNSHNRLVLYGVYSFAALWLVAVLIGYKIYHQNQELLTFLQKITSK